MADIKDKDIDQGADSTDVVVDEGNEDIKAQDGKVVDGLVEIEVDEKPKQRGEEDPGEETDDEKERRRSRRQRQKEAREASEREREALRAELAETRARIARIESAGAGTQLSRIENEMRRAEAQAEEAREIIKQGVAEQKGDAVAAATEALHEARSRYEQLAAARESFVRRANQPPASDPVIARHAKAWADKNAWYDPVEGGEDSEIARAIDKAMHRDGWNPRTPQYWEEFQKRIERRLPHRANGSGARQDDDDDDDPRARRSSPTSGGGRESSGSRAVVKLSAARVEALKEAGQWEDFKSDPKFRARMMARYQEVDRKIAEERK